MGITEEIKNAVIVSVQALSHEPLYEENCMTAMMKSVIKGGAQGLRVAGARDIKNAKRLFNVPVIGITKPEIIPENWQEVVYITPDLDSVNEVITAGADIVAFDGTARYRKGCNLKQIIDTIKSARKISMADISTFEEGVNARLLGADIVSTTLAGYTKESLPSNDEPAFDLLERLVNKLDCPVILEGRIQTPEQVDKAFKIGAHAVVIGGAITKPISLTKKFIKRGK